VKKRVVSEHINNILIRATEVRSQVAKDFLISNDLSSHHTHIPEPYCCLNYFSDVKLIFLGQDPTVQAVKTRSHIQTVLMLNGKGNLRDYIEQICTKVKIDLSHEVYATNLLSTFLSHHLLKFMVCFFAILRIH